MPRFHRTFRGSGWLRRWFVLAVVSLSGALATAAPPALKIGRTGDGKVELSWSASQGAFVLETTDDLKPPTRWSATTTARRRDGNRESLVLVPGEGPRFFRLRSDPGNGGGGTNASIGVIDVLGTYRRLPVQNSWHTGTISLGPLESGPERLDWRNTAGVRWDLSPRLAEGYLATAGTPYSSLPNSDRFTLDIQAGKVVAFYFLGERYVRDAFVQPDVGGLGHSYIHASVGKAPPSFGMGLSFYTSVWRFTDRPYAGVEAGQGSWLIPDNDEFNQPLLQPGSPAAQDFIDRAPNLYRDVFQTIEGGSGVWHSTRFPSATQKWRINGTMDGYRNQLSAPGYGWNGNTYDKTKAGVAQLSNRLLVPPDGLTFADGTDGQVLGYAYMALPFTEPRIDSGVPIGDQSWTLFFNAGNFKGPVAFFLPDSWALLSRTYPVVVGRGLDARPGYIGGVAMEFQEGPGFAARDATGRSYVRTPPLRFPVDADGRTYLLQDAMAYSSAALADSIKIWFSGGLAARGSFERSAAYALKITDPNLFFGMKTFGAGSSLPIRNLGSYAKPEAVDTGSVRALAINWAGSPTPGFFPEYFRHDGEFSTAIGTGALPAEIDLGSRVFPPPVSWGDVVSPTGAESSWAVPGRASGESFVDLNDGSRVRYAWYRFVDQPSIQGLDWSEAEKALVQSRVERIHSSWKSTDEFLPPPSRGELAFLDSALLVTPPPGFEIGYVPVVLGQARIPGFPQPTSSQN